MTTDQPTPAEAYPTYERLDRLIDVDPIGLRDVAWTAIRELLAEVERLSAALEVANHDAGAHRWLHRQVLAEQVDLAARLERVNEALRSAGIEYPLGAAGVTDLAAMAAGRLEDLQTTEAERDRLLDVYRKAEAWRDGWGPDWIRVIAAGGKRDLAGSKLHALIAAVDAYRSATPDTEPAPAKPHLVEQPLPIAVLVGADGHSCGCCVGRGDHECGHECDSCDGAGVEPDAPMCRLPHGADCRCPNAQRPPIRRRYDQCDDTCTTDCGHCKGQGPPAANPLAIPRCTCPLNNGYNRDYGHHVNCPTLAPGHSPDDVCEHRLPYDMGHTDGAQ